MVCHLPLLSLALWTLFFIQKDKYVNDILSVRPLTLLLTRPLTALFTSNNRTLLDMWGLWNGRANKKWYSVENQYSNKSGFGQGIHSVASNKNKDVKLMNTWQCRRYYCEFKVYIGRLNHLLRTNGSHHPEIRLFQVKICAFCTSVKTY